MNQLHLRSRPLVLLLCGGFAVAAAIFLLLPGRASPAAHGAGAGGARSTADAGTLTFRAVLARDSRGVSCSPGAPAALECFAREATGAVPGLGNAMATYIYVVDTAPVDCPSGSFKLRRSTGRFTVAGKGDIEVALNDQPGCYVPGASSNVSQPLTITGGLGIYAGASGGGTVVHGISAGPVGPGRDTWTGTLAVPGLEFDLTPPVISGAVNRTVRAPKRAKRVRVRYSVAARDDVDGVVSASCKPRSGSRFKVGRTVVTCRATDSSANTATKKFTITVKRRR